MNLLCLNTHPAARTPDRRSPRSERGAPLPPRRNTLCTVSAGRGAALACQKDPMHRERAVCGRTWTSAGFGWRDAPVDDEGVGRPCDGNTPCNVRPSALIGRRGVRDCRMERNFETTMRLGAMKVGTWWIAICRKDPMQREPPSPFRASR